MRARLLAVAVLLPLAHLHAQAEWAVGSKPLIDITGTDASGAVVFQNPGGATRLSNGGLLIADRGSTSIRLIDATGKLVRSVGRAGSGPGEYALILSANGCGRDSLLVWARETVVMVGPTGEVARQFKIPADGSRPGPLMSFSCSTAGTIAFLSQPNSRAPAVTPEMMVMLSQVVTTDREGKVLKRVDSVPSGEWMPVPRGAFPRPLGPSTSVVTVAGQVVVGVTDSSRAWTMAPNGSRSEIRIPSTRRAPTAQEFADAVSAVAEMAPVPVRPTVEPVLAKAPVPALLPPYFGLFGDTEGVLWVQLSPPGAKRTDLIAMRLNGQVIARTMIPLPMSIYEIGRDYILGMYSDANDEPHIVVLRLTRS